MQQKKYAYADIGEDGKTVFEYIFGKGVYKTDYLQDPERFLDCILFDKPLELSAQEDLRQELEKYGWSDPCAGRCNVVLYCPANLQYSYRSANSRLIRMLQDKA